MEIFKEKEESDIVKITLDSEGGITINPSEIDLSFITENKSIINKTSVKAKAYVETHNKLGNTCKSELIEMDKFKHPTEDPQDALALGELQLDFNETIISLDELMNYLDNNEEQIDV